jgi:hypothetical protein
MTAKKEANKEVRPAFLLSVWNSSINSVTIVKETTEHYKLSTGLSIAKNSLSQFIGFTREEVKEKLIKKLRDDLERKRLAMEARIRQIEAI